MTIRAQVHNQEGRHRAVVRTEDDEHALPIAPKPSGFGSRTNGGELLFLALATCYCNDVYREAANAGMTIESVAVEVEGEFGGIGEPARNLRYRARVAARGASEEQVRKLLEHTDTVAEIQNTLRRGVAVRLEAVDVAVRK